MKMMPATINTSSNRTDKHDASVSFVRRASFNRIFIPIVLFLLAFGFRVTSLDTFLTLDENEWMSRSRSFLASFNPDRTCSKQENVDKSGLACMPVHGPPGVTTMWTGSLGLLYYYVTHSVSDTHTLSDFLASLPTSADPVDQRLIAPMRFPTVFLSSLLIVIVYALVTRLFNQQVGILTGLLVALNPFLIALSRVLHHDALATVFMTPAALIMLLYFGLERSRRWLVISGIFAGLALITKTVALFLIPYIGLIGGFTLLAGWARGEGRFWTLLRRVLVDWIIWGGIVASGVVIFWPAMWAKPYQTLFRVIADNFQFAQGGHEPWGVFLLGMTSPDPGYLFYPLAWFFRTTPWTIIGLTTALIGGGIILRQRIAKWSGWRSFLQHVSPHSHDDWSALILWISAYIIFFVISISMGAKKQDRYVLPIYPMVEILTAIGLFSLVNILSLQLRNLNWPKYLKFTTQPTRLFTVLLLVVFVSQLYLTVSHFPYYFTYYNPLWGGLTQAVKVVPVGWGEGLNEAADYLNRKANAKDLIVSAWFGQSFAPFFEGHSHFAGEQHGPTLHSDYVVFYVTTTQHQVHLELLDYFERNYKPETEILIDGVTYAQIFPGLAIDHYYQDKVYDGFAVALAWEWTNAINPDEGPVYPDLELPFDFYWSYLGKSADAPFFFRLRDGSGRVWSEAITHLDPNTVSESLWSWEQIIKESGVLVIPSEIAPGIYEVQIGFYTEPFLGDNSETFSGMADKQVIVDVRKLLVLPPGCQNRFTRNNTFEVLEIPHDPLLEAQMQEKAGYVEGLAALLDQAGVIEPALMETGLRTTLTTTANLIASSPNRANDFWSTMGTITIPPDLKQEWIKQGGMARSLQKAAAGYDLNQADTNALSVLAEYFECSAQTANR